VVLLLFRLFSFIIPRRPRSTLFPYTTLFRSVAIVGCGKIADAHASQIQRIGGCELVGVCDREELMARQLAERFHVREYFSDVTRSEEHTSELQSHLNLVCRLLLEKKKKKYTI